MRPETTLDRPSVDPQTGKSVPARQRSRITNGALLPGVDGRNGWVRRCRDILNSHLSDMGGEDTTSAAERSIIRRASTLTVELERLEAKFAVAGQASDADLDLYQRAAGNLRRLLESVGIHRRPRNIYLAGTADKQPLAGGWTSPLRNDLAQADDIEVAS